MDNRKKPIGRGIFYKRKANNGMIRDIYKLMIYHKNSLADKELIEAYRDYYNNLKETNKSIKKFEEGVK